MMRRKIRRGISVLLSLGMACSVSVCAGSATTDAAAGAESAPAAASVKKAAAATAGSSYGDVHADEETGYLYRLYDDGTEAAGQKVEIVGYMDAGIAPMAETGEDTGTELVIPGLLDGKEVTSIGREAFKGNKTITGVTISEGITSIGYSAFQNCTMLTKVSIPSTITEWPEEGSGYENNAFKNCKNIKDLELAEGLTILGQCAFYNCTGLEEVRIPSTIETFMNKVFYNCTSLKKVELPEGVKAIGCQAFSKSALEEVTIPSTITNWSTPHSSGINMILHECRAFVDCKNLQKIVFTEGLKTLYDFCMGSIPQVKEIEVPGSVKDISYAFRGATSLEKITLNEGVNSIGSEAFDDCTALKEIRFPSSILSKESSGLQDATAVERVVFSPLGMPRVDDLTASFGNLKQVYILSDSVGTYKEINLSAGTKVYCPQDSKTYQTYQSALAESGQADKLAAIPRTEAEATAYQAEYDGEEHDAAVLSGIQEGDNVLYCLNNGGRLLKEMPKITDPGKYTVDIYVERAGEGEEIISAFSKLTVEAEIKEAATPTPSPEPTPTPSPVPTPGGQATPTPTPKPSTQPLKVGSAVTAGNFKYKVTNATAGKLAVAVAAPKSKTAKSAVVPATVKASGATYQVTSIAANAFKNCKKLKSVTIGKNVTSIGKNAFSNAKALKKITVKTTKLKSVGKGAFKGIHKKAVIKVPKAKLKKYKKLFKGKGQKKTVKIKK